MHRVSQKESSKLTAGAVVQRVAWAAEEAGQAGARCVAQQAVRPLGRASLRVQASTPSSRRAQVSVYHPEASARMLQREQALLRAQVRAHLSVRTEIIESSRAASPQASSAPPCAPAGAAHAAELVRGRVVPDTEGHASICCRLRSPAALCEEPGRTSAEQTCCASTQACVSK